MSGIAYRNMELVRGDDAELGISKFPPKLMPDCDHLYSSCGLRRVLDRMNHLGCSEQHRNDEDWNHGPGQLNLRAPIHLRRLALCVGDSAAELHYGVYQQTEDHQ